MRADVISESPKREVWSLSGRKRRAYRAKRKVKLSAVNMGGRSHRSTNRAPSRDLGYPHGCVEGRVGIREPVYVLLLGIVTTPSPLPPSGVRRRKREVLRTAPGTSGHPDSGSSGRLPERRRGDHICL